MLEYNVNDRSGGIMDRELIINEAFKIIIENGLEGFSIAKLANELNCTKSSIYNYFKSKDELLNQIFLAKTKLLANGIDLNREPETLIRTYAHNCINNRDVFIFFHRYSHSKFINKDTMCEVKKEMMMSMEVATKLVSSVNHKDVNPIIIEALIFGPIHGIIMRCRKQTDLVISDKDIDDLVDYILGTIRKEM